MIHIAGTFATYGELWFDEEPPRFPGVDVLLFRRRASPIDGELCVPFLSLVNDLSASQDEIAAGFGASNRAHIRRAEKEALEGEILLEPRDQIQQFNTFYDAFAKQKGLQNAYARGLRAACEARALVLSRARKDFNDLVWHAYIVSGSRVSLLHSASHFRGGNPLERRLVSRANRWLHWRDMLEFKQMGIREYDWGGLFDQESDAVRAGINNFKREFGGRCERTFDCDVAVTLKGRAYLIARRAIDRATGD